MLSIRSILQMKSTTLRSISHIIRFNNASWSRCMSNSCGCGSSGDQSSSKHQLTFRPYVPEGYQDHDHKNMKLKRPMSPHLTIYGPTWTSVTSISQRITGAILTFYALLISAATLFLSNGIDTVVSMIQSLDLSRPLLFIIKVLIGLPFGYHYLCGIRFCAWNAGKLLNMKAVYDTAYKAVIGSVVIAVLFALF